MNDDDAQHTSSVLAKALSAGAAPAQSFATGPSAGWAGLRPITGPARDSRLRPIGPPRFDTRLRVVVERARPGLGRALGGAQISSRARALADLLGAAMEAARAGVSVRELAGVLDEVGEAVDRGVFGTADTGATTDLRGLADYFTRQQGPSYTQRSGDWDLQRGESDRGYGLSVGRGGLVTDGTDGQGVDSPDDDPAEANAALARMAETLPGSRAAEYLEKASEARMRAAEPPGLFERLWRDWVAPALPPPTGPRGPESQPGPDGDGRDAAAFFSQYGRANLPGFTHRSSTRGNPTQTNPRGMDRVVPAGPLTLDVSRNDEPTRGPGVSMRDSGVAAARRWRQDLGRPPQGGRG